jgi:hypothetical protein
MQTGVCQQVSARPEPRCANRNAACIRNARTHTIMRFSHTRRKSDRKDTKIRLGVSHIPIESAALNSTGDFLQRALSRFVLYARERDSSTVPRASYLDGYNVFVPRFIAAATQAARRRDTGRVLQLTNSVLILNKRAHPFPRAER